MSSLEETWEEMKTAIEKASFRVFPSELELAGVPVARWSKTSSPQDFLTFAEESGVSVLYAAEERFDDTDTHAPETDEVEDRDELAALQAEARARRGELTFVGVWWVRDGVVHEWTAEADWASDYRDRLESVRARLEDQPDAVKEPDLSGQAKQLAAVPNFQKARTPDQQQYLARKLFPELESEDQGGFDWAFSRLARQARAIYEVDILPEQERQIADRARALMVEGKPRSKTAEELGISDDRLKRILQTNPAR